MGTASYQAAEKAKAEALQMAEEMRSKGSVASIKVCQRSVWRVVSRPMGMGQGAVGGWSR